MKQQGKSLVPWVNEVNAAGKTGFLEGAFRSAADDISKKYGFTRCFSYASLPAIAGAAAVAAGVDSQTVFGAQAVGTVGLIAGFYYFCPSIIEDLAVPIMGVGAGAAAGVAALPADIGHFSSGAAAAGGLTITIISAKIVSLIAADVENHDAEIFSRNFITPERAGKGVAAGMALGMVISVASMNHYAPDAFKKAATPGDTTPVSTLSIRPEGKGCEDFRAGVPMRMENGEKTVILTLPPGCDLK